ncbi:hypothetical protein [Paenibacillus abyssi]|uniref:Uncharacterized protein n=1 Tax=Paenibacillus abyssi TaxID=1340531 RepID=A0A917FMN8_9BACL|nr:hypothetical protein [Paenibacillus abyssi]GGF90168.1 hypothetical protein GCM10010916_04450 [Paenibacillus abyssi]
MNNTQIKKRFAQFCDIRSEADLITFGGELKEEGFTAVRRYLDDFRAFLRSYEDHQQAEAKLLVKHGRIAIPEPKRISPSWEEIWQEFDRIVKYKNKVLNTITSEQRTGEWQVLLDNPFTNQSIVVYPALTFLEAAYMFAYFRAGLTQNEYIRLQRIETLISDNGAVQGDGE